MKHPRAKILPLLFVSILALLMGLWAGLSRLGWPIPVAPTSLPSQHGPLMISGFLGTIIALERVAALRQRWMFAAPLLSGIGWMLSLALPSNWMGSLLITLGSFFAVGILIVIVRREPKIYTLTMTAGVVCWWIGNLFWISGAPIFQIVWIWCAFLVLTIAGERIELSRVLRFRLWQYRVFSLAAGVLLAGAFLDIHFPKIGSRLVGVGLFMLAVWLLRYDIARRNLHHPAPLTRFISTCLYTGFVWLGVSGFLNLIYGPQFAGTLYDAQIHSVSIGFVFSMIFGHALIILPALTQVDVPFRKTFYLPLLILHASLAVRIIGDLLNWTAGRMWGGLVNEIAILIFISFLIAGILIQKKKKAAQIRRPTGLEKIDRNEIIGPVH